MTALVERLVQKWTAFAPFEAEVSNLVAGVLENTAVKIAGGASSLGDHEGIERCD